MTRRRHSTYTPDEMGQHCRSGFMQDRLAEVTTYAAAARWLLFNEAHEQAIEALDSTIDNMREIARTLKAFRAVHEKSAAASEAAARQHAAAVHAAERAIVENEREVA